MAEKADFDFKKIEEKWQKKWEKAGIFEVKESKNKNKYYVLEMFPYPSGSGLHMGHAFNYTIGDIYARLKRMQGFNVLYPMGYDSFGLPAENAAIKEKTHPKKYTDKAINNFIKQQKSLGLSYDWTRMLKTSDPEYYKWNQYFFLKFLEKGLVYRKKASVNFCPKCDTVLANEQVHNGKCWRHSNTDVEIKQLEQWFINTIKYAEELLKEIPNLDWPERIKIMQKNWIGKSEGGEITFKIASNISNCVIVHGSPSKSEKEKTYDKHWIPWIKKELEKRKIKTYTPLMPTAWEPKYNEWKKEIEKLDINEESILIGHSAGGGFLVRWLGETKKRIGKLILVAPAIMHSGNYEPLRDLLKFEINKSTKDNIRETIIFYSDNDSAGILKSVDIFSQYLDVKPIQLKNKGHFTLEDMKTEQFPELLDEITAGKKWKVFTTRPDTLFGVTFLVISAQHSDLMSLVTENKKQEVNNFLKLLKSTKQEDIDKLEKEGVFTGSYAEHPLTKEKIPIYAGNFVLAEYGSGMVMAVPAHDQRDFKFAKKYNLPIKIVIQSEKKLNEKSFNEAYAGPGHLINSEDFNKLFNEEAKTHITKALEHKNLGKSAIQYKLRDWLVSRQRYRGTPIPIIYCEKCGIVPAAEDSLPIKLPEKIKFGQGNPLETNKQFLNTKCPKCKSKARRETDTMDTFFDSSWYYLRYTDNKNNKKPFDKDKVSYWLPVNQYVGGAEHANMHLIYARFFTKALRDLDFLNFNEPFTKLFNQGMLHGEDGYVMSKSRGNIVDPLETTKKYSVDVLRFFLISMSSPDKDSIWSNDGIEGSWRFINKLYSIISSIKTKNSSKKLEHWINKTIKNVTYEIENLRYNTALINIRELLEKIEEEKEIEKSDLESFIKLISPITPHIAEELWEKMGNKTLVSLESWPKADESKINFELEKQEEIIEKTISDIQNIIKILKEKQNKEPETIYLYVIPKEIQTYNIPYLEKKLNKKIKIFAVNDPKKYDPENKSQKAKPNKPGIYLK